MAWATETLESAMASIIAVTRSLETYSYQHDWWDFASTFDCWPPALHELEASVWQSLLV